MDNRKRNNVEQWNDMVARLMPEKHLERPDGLRVLSRTVTFQVTEDCNLACTYCLDGDTMITMSDYSQKPIRDVQIGDKVLGFDEYPKAKGKHIKVKESTVEQIFQRIASIIEIQFDNGETLRITPNHKIPILNNGFLYVEAGDLNVGDIALFHSSSHLEKTSVVSIKPINEEIPVYNIGTSTHTYIANSIAVHNCYQGHKTKKVMSWETAKKAVDMLLSATEENNQYINPAISPGIIIEFIGGEPFLEVELIDRIVDYFKREARCLGHPWAEWYCISVCTNGVNYFDDAVQRFLMKNRDNISLSVTIDGNKELHDSCRVFPDGRPSYDLAVAAALDWMNRGYYMGSKITIAPGNIGFLYDALTHMIELGYTEINANCVYEKGWELSHATVLYSELKRVTDYLMDNDLENEIYISLFEDFVCQPMNPDDNQNYCGGTCDMLCIDPDGNYSICIRYLPSSLGDDQPPIYLGNVDRGLLTTPEEKKCMDCMRCITRRSQSTDECFYCPIAKGCGYCSAYNYQVTGTVNKRLTYICVMHKARALANVYFWNRYFRKHGDKDRFKNYCPDEWALEIISQDELNMLKELEGED